MRRQTENTIKAQVIKFAKEDPQMSPRDIAKLIGCDRSYVYQVLQRSQCPINPENQRISRLEARVKTLEKLFYDYFEAKRISLLSSD